MASTYLSRTLGTSTNTYKGTVSVWLKRSGLSSDQVIYGNYTSGTQRGKLVIAGDGKLMYYQNDGGAVTIQLETNRVLRDVGAFYNIVLSVDTTQATASDRVKLYVNGTQETSFSTATYPSQNAVFYLNANSVLNYIGQEGNSTDYWDGLMSYFSVVDGTAYDASYFGETDSSSGIWKIKTSPSVTWGNNGFFLKMDTSSPGSDTSGNNNTFTASGTPSLTQDNASNVFATLNSLYYSTSQSTLSNGNLTATSSGANWNNFHSTIAPSTGKWYWEVKVVNVGSNTHPIGIVGADWSDINSTSPADSFDNDTTGISYVQTGDKDVAGSRTSYGDSYTTGDIIGVAMDLDNHKLYFSKNGTYQNSGVPTSGATGTGAISIVSGHSYLASFAHYNTMVDSINFGNGFFGTTAVTSSNADAAGYGLMEYAVPTGYYTLCTKNLNTYG